MASPGTKPRGRTTKRERTAADVTAPQRGERTGRRASEKTEQYRFAQNVSGAGTAAERAYEAYALDTIDDPRGEPDVLLDVPVIKVDSIHLQLEDLDAHVALQARVLDLVKLNAGVDVHLGKLRVDIKGVEAQALLKVRLDHVAAIVDRVLTTLDRNPGLVKSLGRAVEHVGEGTGHALGETGEAVEDIGEGAQGAVEDVGAGAGEAVGDVGEGAGQAVGDIGEGAGGALGDLEGVVTGALQGGGNGGSAKSIAKLAAKFVAHELKAAATEEAKELGLAATRKAIEVGERRKQRKADELNATPAALRIAQDLGVELADLEGTGPEGRITIRDVRQAQED